MRYKNYILSKGDKVKLKATGDDWLPSMTKNYGGKVVTIKDFIYNIGFICVPLGDNVASYMFDVDDIDEVVYCSKNSGEKIYEIKAALQCCSVVGFETSCSDCPYCYRCQALSKDALNFINEQENEIERLKAENTQLTTKLGQVLLAVDTVKEMNTMCNIDDHIKKAVKEFAEKLRKQISDTMYSREGYVDYDDTMDVMDELLKEYEK